MISRLMKEQDIDIVTKIFVNAYYQAPWNEQWDFKKARQRLSDVFEAPNGLCVICENENQILGVILCLVVSWTTGYQLEVRDIFVDPSCQNQNIGSFLLNEVICYARKDENIEIVLSTKDDPKLIHFYNKSEFVLEKDIIFFSKRV